MARIVNSKKDKEKKLAEKKTNAQKRSKAIFVLDNVKEQMLVEFSKNIPSEIDKREKEFMKELERFEMAHTNEKGIVIAGEQFDTAEFVDNAFKPIIRVAGMSPKYSADNVYMALDYFKQCVKKINKYGLYIPMKEDFCSFLGLSTSRFNDFKKGNDLEMREVCQQVEDYLASQLSQAGLVGKSEKLTNMFYQRVSLNRVEPREAERVSTVTNNFILNDEAFRELARKYSDNTDN